MSRKEELLQDHVYIVGGKVQENVDAPNGIVFKDEIESMQQELLTFTMEHLISTLIDVEKTYPKEDTMNIKLTTDFVVMRREDFDELYREDDINKYPETLTNCDSQDNE